MLDPKIFDPRFDLGLLPFFFSDSDERPAREQAHYAYSHGGGWRPFEGFTLGGDADSRYTISYPGDPTFHEVARMKLRDEIISIFPYSWVAIIQPDGSFEISRMD